MHERLIFQSVSKNISLQLKEELKRKVWESLETDGDTLRLGFYGKVVLVRKTAIVYAAPCEGSSILVPRHPCRVQCIRKSY